MDYRHPIDENSPFRGKTQEDLTAMQAELIILVKGFDETFSQIVHSRYSYRHDEFVWGANSCRRLRLKKPETCCSKWTSWANTPWSPHSRDHE